MEENFNIHLVSNVSKEIYPKNSPSQFTTLLSNEISLKDQGWEVGVHDIMYPSQLTEYTDDDDYFESFQLRHDMRTLLPHNINPEKSYLDSDKKYILPHNIDANQKLIPWTINVGKQLKAKTSEVYKTDRFTPHVQIELSAEQKKKFEKIAAAQFKKQLGLMGEKTCQLLNELNKSVKDIIEFQFGKDSQFKRRFTIEVKKENILVMLTNDLAKFLGFPKLTGFFHGKIYATQDFDISYKEKVEATAKIFYLDILNMQTESIEPLPPSNEPRDRHALHYDIPYSFDKTKLSAEAVESIPNDYKFTLKINFKHKRFLLSTETPLKEEHRQHYETFILFTFDDKTMNEYGFKKYFVFEYDFDGHRKKMVGKFNKLRHDLQVNNWKMPKLSAKVIKQLRLSRPKLVIYKIQARQFSLYQRFLRKWTVDISERVNSPTKHISALNPTDIAIFAKNPATFTFDEVKNRFTVKIHKDYSIKLSPSLAWKLGFTDACSIEQCDFITQTVTAKHFPIFYREIHELYVYSNIIEASYVGDVQAPLLLLCPFRRNKEAALIHLEFQNPTYKKLNRNTFQQIEIGIYDAYGKPINFTHGRTVVNLHFRKVTT